ncbi:MAG: methyltransferase [Planctomycetaceae bacterium]|nr:methyltransferase [Planctomycetaceae bacterium]
MEERSIEEIKLPASERLAMNATANFDGESALFCTVGRGQAAIDLARRHPDARVVLQIFDQFRATETQEFDEAQLPNLEIRCTADFPETEFDLFVLPLTRGGEAELARDLLQFGYQQLKKGGQFVAAVDNPKDTWLMHEIEKLAKNITRTPKRHGVLYRLQKQSPLKRFRDFRCEFGFRDGDRVIKVISRPGVFSHRRLDLGARALIESMEIPNGARVLDVGCGSGAVGLAAALRASDVRVYAVDSNPRALDSAKQGATLNGISGFHTALSAEGDLVFDGLDESGTFDVAVGNPPYYSHYQIAEIFLQTARKALRPGGRTWMVTKHPEWMVARMQQLFLSVESREVRGYHIVSGVRSERT